MGYTTAMVLLLLYSGIKVVMEMIGEWYYAQLGLNFNFGLSTPATPVSTCPGYPLYLRFAPVPLLSRSPSAVEHIPTLKPPSSWACRRATTFNLKPQTSNLKPQTSNLKPQTSFYPNYYLYL